MTVCLKANRSFLTQPLFQINSIQELFLNCQSVYASYIEKEYRLQAFSSPHTRPSSFAGHCNTSLSPPSLLYYSECASFYIIHRFYKSFKAKKVRQVQCPCTLSRTCFSNGFPRFLID